MAKLSQRQLEEMAKQRKSSEGNTSLENNSSDLAASEVEQGPHDLPRSKVINEIMGDMNAQLYKYELPMSSMPIKDKGAIPFVNPKEYPKFNIRGKVTRDRQSKPIKFYLLKEIEEILKENNGGSNKTAALNFLIWVGLQTIKGMNQSIDVLIHDDTYADGEVVRSFLDPDND